MDISIIISAHEDRGYLDEAIVSALSQEFRGTYEIILASDGNEELYAYAQRFGILFNHVPKANFSTSVNHAILHCRGKYIKILADDDRLPVRSLQILRDNIGDHAIIHANAINFSKKASSRYKPKPKVTGKDLLINGCHVHGGTWLLSKDAFFDVGGYDESLDCCEEYDLYLNLLKRGYSFTYIDNVVYEYRLHHRQKSLNPNSPRRMAVKTHIMKRYENTFLSR